MAQHHYDATFSRSLAGLLTAAALLASIIPIGLIVTRKYDGTDMSAHMDILLYMAGIWFWVAFQFYLVSAVLIVAPIWAFFHSRGCRSWRAALLISALLVFAWTFGHNAWLALYGDGPWETISGDGTLIRPELSIGDWLNMAGGSAVYTAISCVAALIIWRIAYRKAPAREA